MKSVDDMTNDEKARIVTEAKALARAFDANDLEVDDDANVIDSGDEGYWVGAWIFVRAEEEDDDDGDNSS